MVDKGESMSEQPIVGRTFKESTPAPPVELKAPEGAPNIVVILLDDLGFSDFGCFGSEIDTPVADRLAAEGLRYTNFHVTPVCSPSRACLLTGRNHHTAGMGIVANPEVGYPGYRGVVPRSTAMLGEMLKPHGYSSYMVGKWHLTPMRFFNGGPYDNWPINRGFDRFYGTPGGGTHQFRPALIEDNHWVRTPDDEDYHFSSDIVDKAIDMVLDHRYGNPDRPFFSYISFCAPHFPHHVPRPYVDKYLDRFRKGWDQTRIDRLERQKELGIVEPDTELPPRNPGVKAWDSYDERSREAMVHLQAAFAGMVDHTDEQIGRFIDMLEELGELDNTVVMLLSDNGASQEGGEVGSLFSMRVFQGGFDPPAEIDEITENLDTIGSGNWANNYALGWSMAGNTPLKRWKRDTHGGGVHSSLIVRYPAKINDPGGVRRQFHHAVDLVPTLFELIGIDEPATVNGVEQVPIAGESFAYTFDQPDASTPRTVQYFEFMGQRAIWRDGWKAVTHHSFSVDFDDDVWELYHLHEDWNEIHDLAEERPELLADLIETWWAEAEKHGALPLGATVNGIVGGGGPMGGGGPPRRPRKVGAAEIRERPREASDTDSQGALEFELGTG